MDCSRNQSEGSASSCRSECLKAIAKQETKEDPALRLDAALRCLGLSQSS